MDYDQDQKKGGGVCGWRVKSYSQLWISGCFIIGNVAAKWEAAPASAWQWCTVRRRMAVICERTAWQTCYYNRTWPFVAAAAELHNMRIGNCADRPAIVPLHRENQQNKHGMGLSKQQGWIYEANAARCGALASDTKRISDTDFLKKHICQETFRGLFHGCDWMVWTGQPETIS